MQYESGIKRKRRHDDNVRPYKRRRLDIYDDTETSMMDVCTHQPDAMAYETPSYVCYIHDHDMDICNIYGCSGVHNMANIPSFWQYVN